MATLTASPSVQMSVGGYSEGGSVPLPRGSHSTSIKGVRKSLSRQLQPSTSASIPSRYQTFFLSSSEPRGFNSQATRFSHELSVNENPGPGSYAAQNGSLQTNKTSFSKKGTGGFASRTKRFSRNRSQKLGPGSYDPGMMEGQRDFNRSGVSRNFQQPVAVATDVPVDTSPAPNTYNLSGLHTGKNSLVSAEAAFKSRSQRGTLTLHGATNPAPGQYSVRDDLLHRSTCGHKAVFDSRSQREAAMKPVKGPGPADYSPYPVSTETNSEPKALPYYRQKHYLCISAPAMPLPPLPPPPGPGHYETQGSTDTERKLVTGAVFRSNTSRWTAPEKLSGPGPGTYNPSTLNKRSYLYNVQRKWI